MSNKAIKILKEQIRQEKQYRGIYTEREIEKFKEAIEELERPRLSKEEFMRYMYFIKKQNDFDNAYNDFFRKNRDIVGDAEAPMSQSTGYIVELLEEIMNLPKDDYDYTTLSWWIFDLDFGKEFVKGYMENCNLPENHEYRYPDLSDLDKLYDYLIWESNN